MTDSSPVRPRLRDLMKPYKTVAIAEATGVSRQAAALWRAGTTIPDLRALPGLADFLKIELGELTEIVAAELRRRDSNAQSVGA